MDIKNNHTRLRAHLARAFAEIEGEILASLEAGARSLESAPEASWPTLCKALGKDLHDFYLAVEGKVIEPIIDESPEGRPKSGQYHADLLRQAVLEIPPIRPPIIAEDTRAKLDDFREFLHVFRRVYGAHLKRDRLLELAPNARPAFDTLKRDVQGFLQAIEPPAE